MAKTPTTPEPPARETLSVWLPRELVQMAKVIGTHRDQTIADILSDILREPLRKQYRKAVAEMDVVLGGEG